MLNGGSLHDISSLEFLLQEEIKIEKNNYIN